MNVGEDLEDVEMEVVREAIIDLDEDSASPVPFSPPEDDILSVPSPSVIVPPDANTNPPPILLYDGVVNSPSLEALNVQVVKDVWLSKFRDKGFNPATFYNSLVQYWVSVVPHVYTLQEHQDCINPFQDSHSLVQSYLMEPMIGFLTDGLCRSDLDFKEFLTKSDQPPTVCGKVFQVGEATYSCRECGMDPTCVLCAECFKQSEHRNHKYLIGVDDRYKIATSAGGGYCDCGDPEAWRQFVHCESHKPRSGAGGGLKDSEQEEFERRASILVPNLLVYAFELSTSALDRRLPKSIEVITEGLGLGGFKDDDERPQQRYDLFCTVLYNDETHTFDFVIQTLSRALQCEKKHAMEFATTIDREGRSLVKVANFNICHEIQKIIERSTQTRGPHSQPLQCVVMKREVIQHQAFALKVLSWIEFMCAHNLSVRKIVQDALYGGGAYEHTTYYPFRYGPREEDRLIDYVLLKDTKLWKAARSCWHRVIIAALLKEYESKKTFAEVFTRQYPFMMDDFIRDDHDHSYSVTSLSVQIFTVPSIAHYLVEMQDIIYTIIRVLLAQCDSRVTNGRLEFDRNALVTAAAFKRTNFAILDLKYILTNPPLEWSPTMVKNYTHGIDSFLKFLSYMQDMDSVTRQVDQHMEYEPEWESAFNLHIKLQPVVQLSLDWCGLNKTVFVRAFRHCLCDLSKAYESLKQKTETVELANHSATCYVYDVSSQPVSVHLPLTRYFAGLYLHLDRFELSFFSSEFTFLQTEKPVPEMIMEPALRCQVLCAQVNASMWKRNGYALLNQLYFYHNVRCRADMLDKDIMTLQIAASIIEANEFILHVINRFKLVNWIRTGLDGKQLKSDGQDDDYNKHFGVITEEFLALLITLVSARFVPGVGQVTRADCVKKEVIQQLCIESMTHSTLNKSLVENVNMETGLELVIHEVANQRGPTPQRTSVVYELKPEFYKDYDIYHYHYTREEMSKAEETQRARKKGLNDPEIFPPPRLPPFTHMFDMLINILQCDVFLHIINLVLAKSLQKSNRIFGESLIRKALHLIGLGLNEELIRNEKESEHFFQFSHNATKWKIFELLEQMLKESSLRHYHDMILWLRDQHNLIKPQTGTQDNPVVAQPDEEEERRQKAERVKEAKMKMMAKMAAAQQKFMQVNKDLFTEAADGDAEMDAQLSISPEVEMASVDTIAVGPNQHVVSNIPDEKFVCMLCKEEQSMAVGNKRFVLATFIQKSTVMAQYREKLTEESNTENIGLPNAERQHPFVLNPNLNYASVMSTCGHVMHDHCWTSHMDTVISKERRRPYRLRHPMSFDVDKLEWLCPMCGVICNAALPMTLPLAKLYPVLSLHEDCAVRGISPAPYDSDTPGSFAVWLEGMLVLLENKATDKTMKLSVTEAYDQWAMKRWEYHEENILFPVKSVSLSKICKQLQGDAREHLSVLFPRRKKILGDNFVQIRKWLATGFHPSFMTFMVRNYTTALDLEQPKGDDIRMLPLMWNCLSFTIISSEAYHRDQNLPFFGDQVPLRRWMGIKYLTRACGITVDRQCLRFMHTRSIAIRLLSLVLNNKQSEPTLFESDPFGLLVSLTYSLPTLFELPPPSCCKETEPEGSFNYNYYQPPSGGRGDHHILRLVYMYHITQILLTNDFKDCVKRTTTTSVELPTSEDEDMEWDTERFNEKFVSRIQYITTRIWQKAKKTDVLQDFSRMDFNKVWESVQQSAIPFLRCCAKFYECLTGIAPPSQLQNVDTPLDALLKYLDLPKEFDALFVTPRDWQMPYKWASHPRVPEILGNQVPLNYQMYPITWGCTKEYLPEVIPIKYPRSLPSLAQLPYDYSELINEASNFTCKNSKSLDSRTPTLCLMCGLVLCSQSYCCQKEVKPNVTIGSCIHHAQFCGGGCGIFLRVRECRMFFTYGHNRGCYLSPPYLDEYGEPDQGLRRGNPLKISLEKYQHFRNIWIQHGIPEHIARLTEQNSAVAATEWQHF